MLFLFLCIGCGYFWYVLTVLIHTRFGTVFYNPGRHLLVQSQQWKRQNNVCSLFKFNNKDKRIMSLTLFLCLYLQLWTDFTQISLFFCFHCWIWISKYRLGQLYIDSILWTKHMKTFLRFGRVSLQDKRNGYSL